MARLYKSQAEIVNAFVKAYKDPQLTMQHHIYISGEMGTGKTYMGCAIAAELNPKHVLISCPSSMPKKWAEVYQDFTNVKPLIFNKKTTTAKDIANAPAVIVVQKDLYTLVNLVYSDSMSQSVLIQLEALIKSDVKYGEVSSLTNFEKSLPHYFDFVICDEIHTYKPTTQVFRALAALCQSNVLLLGLTGTLFKQNIADLHCLLSLTNPEFNGLSYTDDDLRDPSWFYPNIWQYISAPISLKDVERNQQEEQSEEELKQNIMPLHGLTLSDEQQAWYDLAICNLKRLGISKSKIDQVTTSYLDLPQMKQPSVNRSVADESDIFNKTRIRKKYFSGMTLSPIKLENTPKFKQVKDILKKHPEKTIIFVQDTNLGKILTKYLDKSFIIPASIANSDVAAYVNDRLNTDYDIVIATTKQISTGIDLNSAHQVIWYQVPSDVTAVLQAQRRVLRLNSTTSSTVWFLYYNNTAQEQTIKDVSHASTNNAAAYNVRATDNLSRLTGILFGNIDNLD